MILHPGGRCVAAAAAAAVAAAAAPVGAGPHGQRLDAAAACPQRVDSEMMKVDHHLAKAEDLTL